MRFDRKIDQLEYLAKKYDETNIPLYVSYPTTGFWKNSVSSEHYAERGKPVDKPFLYFHFPYCPKACYYCCCYKQVTSDPNDIDIYLNYLAKEFNQKLDFLQREKIRHVSQLHWGGGTPTYLSVSQIERFFLEMEKRIVFDHSDESSISIEAYPDKQLVTTEKLELLKELGFNQISFGIQDFDARIQKTINRSYRRQTAEELIYLAKKIGFKVHVDLCYGLPFQGLNEFERTAKAVIETDPDRVAVYPYAHYPFTFELQRLIPKSSIPNSFIKVLIAQRAQELFQEKGYIRIGSDHYVKKSNKMFQRFEEGKVERDFMGYSVDERRQFFGFGNSAISFLGETLYHNIIKIPDYFDNIEKGGFGLDKSMAHILSSEDLVRKKTILKHLLTNSYIDKTDLEEEFQIEFDQFFRAELPKIQELEKDGLVQVSDTQIKLSEVGNMFCRHVAHVFDEYYH